MINKKKQIQIPEELFLDLIRWHLVELRDEERAERIRHELSAKLDAMARRELYEKSHNAETPEAREVARREYLDRVGIHQDFRW